MAIDVYGVLKTNLIIWVCAYSLYLKRGISTIDMGVRVRSFEISNFIINARTDRRMVFRDANADEGIAVWGTFSHATKITVIQQ